MIRTDSNHCRIVADSIADERDVDEKTFAKDTRVILLVVDLIKESTVHSLTHIPIFREGYQHPGGRLSGL